MITAMPMRIWMVMEARNSSMMMAITGEPRICATAAWLRPSSVIRMITVAMVSGILAIAVTR